MSTFEVFAPGAYGAKQSEEFSYSQVMEADGRVELSGQGGWHPQTLDYPDGVSIETEVGRAFDNVEAMLKSVGLDWSHVASIHSDHVPEPDGFILGAIAEAARQLRLRMPTHKPIWTAAGVVALVDPGMRVEVRVTAFRRRWRRRSAAQAASGCAALLYAKVLREEHAPGRSRREAPWRGVRN